MHAITNCFSLVLNTQYLLTFHFFSEQFLTVRALQHAGSLCTSLHPQVLQNTDGSRYISASTIHSCNLSLFASCWLMRCSRYRIVVSTTTNCKLPRSSNLDKLEHELKDLRRRRHIAIRYRWFTILSSKRS